MLHHGRSVGKPLRVWRVTRLGLGRGVRLIDHVLFQGRERGLDQTTRRACGQNEITVIKGAERKGERKDYPTRYGWKRQLSLPPFPCTMEASGRPHGSGSGDQPNRIKRWVSKPRIILILLRIRGFIRVWGFLLLPEVSCPPPFCHWPYCIPFVVGRSCTRLASSSSLLKVLKVYRLSEPPDAH